MTSTNTDSLEKFQTTKGLPNIRKAASDALRAHSNNPFKARAKFHRELMRNEQLLFALEIDFLRRVAEDNRNGRETDAGQSSLETHGSRARIPFSGSLPVSKTFNASVRRDAQRKVARGIAVTILDTFRVRDGRSIGDVKWYELGRLQTENTYEAKVIQAVRLSRASVPDDSMLVREIIRNNEFAKIEREVKESCNGRN